MNRKLKIITKTLSLADEDLAEKQSGMFQCTKIWVFGSCIMSLFKILHFFQVLTMLSFPCNCQSGPVCKLMILYLCENEVLVWKLGWNG